MFFSQKVGVRIMFFQNFLVGIIPSPVLRSKTEISVLRLKTEISVKVTDILTP